MGIFRNLLRISIVIVLLAIAIHRPLPDKLTASPPDRTMMHVLEPIGRLICYYPIKLCPSANCLLRWSRWSLDLINRLMGPSLKEETNLFMETTYWDGVKVRVYHSRTRAAALSDGAIVYMHGGGFGVGSVEMFEPLTRTMAEQMSTRLFVSIDYPLAPESPFPGALLECERVLEYVIAHGPAIYGIDASKIIVMGDSAGGTLATVLAQRRRKQGDEPKILGQVLLYPVLQMSDLQTPSYRFMQREMRGLMSMDVLTTAYFCLWYAGIDANAHDDYAIALTKNAHVSEEAKRMRDKYLNFSLLPESFCEDAGVEKSEAAEINNELAAYMEPLLMNPDFAPLMQSDLSDLPSTLVVTCQYDNFRDEGAIYAKRLEQAGVPTQWTHYEHGFHSMLNAFDKLEIARHAPLPFRIVSRKDALSDVTSWTMKLLREAEIQ